MIRGGAPGWRVLVALFWVLFLTRGILHAVVAPMWAGFDEPGHLAYVDFVAENGRPPGFTEPSIPESYYAALPLAPSHVGLGAPDFPAWRALSEPERARRVARRAEATTLASAPGYRGANYERQQGPLFYWVAAPVARAFRTCALLDRMVAVRLFCVLLASFVVPLTGTLARLVAGRRAALLALPLVALLPGTPFFAFRVTNDALALPLSAALAVQLVLACRRPTSRRFLILGLLVAAGVWTKLTLLPAFPAALAVALLAGRRVDGRRLGIRPLALAVGLPALLTAPLFLSNLAGTGSLSGILYARNVGRADLATLLDAVGRFHPLIALIEWWRTWFWSGGWAFTMAPAWVYDLALAAALGTGLVGLVLAIRGRDPLRGFRRTLPLALFALAFLGAMAFHRLSCRISEVVHPTGTTCGSEGWYFEVLRPAGAVWGALLLAALVRGRRTGSLASVLAVLLASVDAALTVGILLPYWAGFGPRLAYVPGSLAEAVAASVRGALAAAPVPPAPAAAWGLLALYVFALLSAVAAGLRADRAPAEPRRHA